MTILSVKKIDELGRIVLPYELRHRLNIKPGDGLAIGIYENDNIILKPTQNKCIL